MATIFFFFRLFKENIGLWSNVFINSLYYLTNKFSHILCRLKIALLRIGSFKSLIMLLFPRYTLVLVCRSQGLYFLFYIFQNIIITMGNVLIFHSNGQVSKQENTQNDMIVYKKQ